MRPEADVDLEQSRGTGTGELRLQILGPLRIWRGSVEIDAGPAQQAVLLAVLLARAGRPVSTDELAWAVWGETPPPSALNTIQKYVGALRRLFEPELSSREAGSFLQRRGDAYVCTAGRDVLDLIEFRSLIEGARAAQRDQRTEEALDGYLRALALWAGPAGAGLTRGSNSTSVFVTLNAEFLDACAKGADLALSLGVPERALPPLQAAVTMDPYHEPLHARLISALGAAEQQAEALSVFRTMRRRLSDELGLDPGEALMAAERAVLTSSSRSGVVEAERGSKAHSRSDELIGRADELSMLWSAASSALEGGTGIVMLEGEPGIGKTRILQAVCTMAERHGMLVVRGQCIEGEGTPALWPWIQVVTALLDSLPAAERKSWLRGELGELIVPAHDAVAGPLVPDIGARFRLFERVVALFRASAALRPILLVMDDVHWADLASLRMFGHLAVGMPPGMAIMGALRDRAPATGPELATLLAGVSRSPNHRRVRLNALSPLEVMQLVHIEIGSAIVPSVARGLHDRTAGNPFFVLELARLLVDSQGEPQYLVARTGVPSTVLDVVRDRTSRLDEQTKYMLQVAAVIGTELDISVLAQSCGIDEQTCLDRFQEVEELGVLATSSSDPRLFRFAHDLVRESVVATTPPGRLPRIHLDVADALGRQDAGRGVAVERVAYHLWSAGPLADSERTADALLRAGRMAASKCAYEAATRHLQSAAEIARAADLPRIELDALTLLARATGESSGYTDFAVGERAERLARKLGEDREAANQMLTQYIACAQQNQIESAGRRARTLLDYGETSTDAVVRAMGYFAWGTHQRDVGNIGEAHRYLTLSDEIIVAAEPDSDGLGVVTELWSNCRLWVAQTTAFHGDIEAARSILQEAGAAETGPYDISVAATVSIVVAALAGDSAWCERAAERGLAVDPDDALGFHGTYQRLGRCWARAMSGHSPAEMAAEAAAIVATLEDPPRADLPTCTSRRTSPTTAKHSARSKKESPDS